MSRHRLIEVEAEMNKLDSAKTALLIINMTNDLLGWEGVRPLGRAIIPRSARASSTLAKSRSTR